LDSQWPLRPAWLCGTEPHGHVIRLVVRSAFRSFFSSRSRRLLGHFLQNLLNMPGSSLRRRFGISVPALTAPMLARSRSAARSLSNRPMRLPLGIGFLRRASLTEDTFLSLSKFEAHSVMTNTLSAL